TLSPAHARQERRFFSRSQVSRRVRSMAGALPVAGLFLDRARLSQSGASLAHRLARARLFHRHMDWDGLVWRRRVAPSLRGFWGGVLAFRTICTARSASSGRRCLPVLPVFLPRRRREMYRLPRLFSPRSSAAKRIGATALRRRAPRRRSQFALDDSV